MLKFYSYAFVLLNTFQLIISDAAPILEIADGKIIGTESTTPSGKYFNIFQGIPYAAPPLGNLRFVDPQPPKKWETPKNCSNKNIVCYQSRQFLSEFETEDCLVLNVYTPKIPKNVDDSNLAVMVYFYGGGFYIGNSTYDAYGPEFLIDYDVVVVTINYRLGPFGFLSTQDSIISGNFGLKDQQLALKWVQTNIGVFGGDSKKVTIFGNSAGSASVGYQILNKENEGLFRAAIMSSGSPLNSFSHQNNPKEIAFKFAQTINDTKTIKSSTELLQFLRQIPALKLRQACIDLMAKLDPFEVDEYLNGYFFAPVHHTSRSYGNIVYEDLRRGEFVHIPIMMGMVSEEFLSVSDAKDFFESSLKKFDSNPELMISNLNLKNEENKKLVGNMVHKIYVKDGNTLEKNLKCGLTFFSDQILNNGIIKHAYLASNYTDIFLYYFSYDGSMGNYTSSFKGVSHTEDMNYIWRRNIPTANNMNLDDFPENDRIIQKRLLTLYTNFAKYLNPTPIFDNLLQNITWKSLKTPYENFYLDIHENLELKTDLKNDTFHKWNNIYAQYISSSTQ